MDRVGFPFSVVRVLDAAGRTAGAGFVVASDLVVTCAHVVAGAGGAPGAEISVQVGETPVRGRVEPDFWRAADTEDVAVLRLAGPMPGTAPVTLQTSTGVTGLPFATYGFPDSAARTGMRASGTIEGEIPGSWGGSLLQLGGSNAITTGFSGAPVVDLATGNVLGMISAITARDRYGRQGDTTFATPAEVIRGICSDLAVADEPPYRSLEAFEERHARFFHGRDAFIERLLGSLRAQPRFLAVLGPSGSGKSSVIRAGLLPRLGQAEVASLIGHHTVVVRPADLSLLDEKLPGALRDLPGAVAAWRDGGSDRRGIVIVFDQFEEVFVTLGQAARHDLINQLVRLVDERDDVCLVIVMRDDFYSRLAGEAPGLMHWVERGLGNVPATVDHADLVSIVERPARSTGVTFQPGLVDTIVTDAIGTIDAGPGDRQAASSTVLPLLEFVLGELWRLRSDGTLLHSTYHRLGGVTGTLTRWADDAYHALPEAKREVARRIFTRLVHLGDEVTGIPDSRWKRPLRDLYRTDGADREMVESVVYQLAGRRLLITTGEGNRRVETAELIHDVLLREWGLLQQWLRRDREFLAWRQELDGWVRAWRVAPNPADKLLRGTDLQVAIARMRAAEADLNDEHLAFIASSRDAWENEQRERRELEEAAARHRRAESEAQVRYRAAEAAALAGTAPLRALGLAVRAIAANLVDLPGEEPLGAVLTALHTTVHRARERQQDELPSAVRCLAVSPDGLLVAGGGDDRRIHLWGRDGQARGEPLAGHDDSVCTLAFSPDGRFLVSGGADGAVRMWSRQGQPLGRPLTGHDGAVNALAFSPDGAVLASAGDDGTVRLWSVASGGAWQSDGPRAVHRDHLVALVFHPDGRRVIYADGAGVLRSCPLTGAPASPQADPAVTIGRHDDLVSALAVDRGGTTLASGGAGGVIRLWALDSSPGQVTPPATITHDEGFVYALAFSSDGEILVSAGDDHQIRLWDHRGRRPAHDPLVGHTAEVTAVAVAPDHTYIVSAGADRAVRFWDWRAEIAPASADPDLRGVAGETVSASRWDVHGYQTRSGWRVHREYIYQVSLSPDGTAIATASDDRTIRISDLTSGLVSAPISGHANSVRSVTFSPDGQLLVSGSMDGTVRLWSRLGQEIGDPLPHGAAIHSVAISPDGEMIASGGDDATMRLWDVGGGSAGPAVTGFGGPVTAVVFHPDGQRLVAACGDGTIRIFDRDGRLLTPPFLGHNGGALTVAVAADGSKIASGGADRTVRLWSLEGTPLERPFIGHESDVLSVAFHPSGTMVLSAGRDASVRLWASDGTAIGSPMLGHTSWVTCVLASADGRHALSAGVDATIRIWRLGTWRDWAADGCGRLVRHRKYPAEPDLREACALLAGSPGQPDRTR
jgi:WD40 repeat protein